MKASRGKPGEACLDELRQYHENDRQWAARRQFLARHMHLYPGHKLDQLIALSVVWSNIVFIGNRYGEQLTQKVYEMAEGIDVGEMPSFELVPGAKKRSGSSDAGPQPLKKKLGPRPRFEPVHFVSSSVEEERVIQKTDNLDSVKPPATQQKSELQSGPRPRFAPVHFVSSSVEEERVYHNTNDLDSKKPPATPQKPELQSGPRPRFAPVHFVSSSVEEERVYHNTNNLDNEKPSATLQNPEIKLQTSNAFGTASDHSEAEDACETELSSDPYVYDPSVTDDQSKNDFGSFMTKLEQNYSAKFESHSSSLSKHFRSNLLDSFKSIGQQGRKGIGFVKPPKKSGNSGRDRHRGADSLRSRAIIHTLDNSAFFKHLSGIVKQHMINPKMAADNKHVNFTHVLTQSIQACKMNPEYIYAPIKDLPPDGVPKYVKVPPDGFACEVRCQNVYLATGYSWSKNGSRDRAAELAIQVLMKPAIDVTTVTRKCGNGFRDDLVVNTGDKPIKALPPILKPEPEPSVSDNGQPNYQFCQSTRGTSARPWSEFILFENACDAIGILNNSATFNKMSVSFKYDMVHDKSRSSWHCSVFVQDHFIADGYGNKKTSKHAAAEAAVKVLRTMQPNVPMASNINSQGIEAPRQLKDILVYENSLNPVCTLNDTAQFNKVNIEYIFERASGLNWRCKVLLDQQFVAEAVALKKNVKHQAAEAALTALKKTQPVVVNNLKKGPDEDAISRNHIRGVSSNEAYKQQIKEDNIGNQLLRKMGWTGGGLGKEGEGIAEPISVKEQFKREGLGLMTGTQKITKRDIEQVLRNYAASYNQDDLTFSRELSNEERKLIHQIAQKYGLKSKSHGQGTQRFLVVSRKRNRADLLHQLKQEGQVGSYALVMPQD